MIERYTVRYRSKAPGTAVLLVEDSNGCSYVYSTHGLQIRVNRPDGCVWLFHLLGGSERWARVDEDLPLTQAALGRFFASGEQ